MARKFDPILVEVVKNELAAITEEMAIAVWKTGRSAMVKTGDFATAICDGQGRLIGLGYAAPFQLAFFIQGHAAELEVVGECQRRTRDCAGGVWAHFVSKTSINIA